MKHSKLVMLTTGLAYGGAETQLVHLATRLKARGWQVTVISMLPPQAYVQELAAMNIPVHSLNMRRGVPDPRALFHLAAILREERPKILHSHMVHANIMARVARALTHIPVVICTAHTVNEGGRHREWAYRLTDPLCDLTTQVSQVGMERYVRVGAVPRNKIKFVPNGVDTKLFRPDREARERLRAELNLHDSFVWLAVGRFEEAKDYPTLLRAYAKVAQNKPPSRLLIAGHGPLLETIKGLAARLNITSFIHFLGIRKDVSDLMNAADGFVMSSRWEGMPMVLLEAAATGLPIVATDVGGNREIVLHNQSGFLVPPAQPDALAEAMQRLMNLPHQDRLSMGLTGREYVVQRYDLEKIVDQWEAIYCELLKKKQA